MNTYGQMSNVCDISICVFSSVCYVYIRINMKDCGALWLPSYKISALKINAHSHSNSLALFHFSFLFCTQHFRYTIAYHITCNSKFIWWNQQINVQMNMLLKYEWKMDNDDSCVNVSAIVKREKKPARLKLFTYV